MAVVATGVRAESAERSGYRTFPSRLPVILTAFGGAFVVLGAFGAWVRASALLRAEEDPKTVRVLKGSAVASGWMLAVLGAVLLVAAFAWLGRRMVLKAAAVALVVVVEILVASRLLWANHRAAEWADVARRTPTFIGFHAGLGWGAWCLLVGAILAGFGLLTGVLREIDVRKGIAG